MTRKIKSQRYSPTKDWYMKRLRLKNLFREKGIVQCEIQTFGCWRNNALGFAHLHKRIWYLPKENRELLGDFKQVLLACTNCHQKIEGNKSLTEDFFKRLRP